MSLTANQDIPLRPEEPRRKWTATPLINLQHTAQILAKNFSALEVVLFFMVAATALAILLNRYIPWPWYLLLFLLTILAFGAGFFKPGEKLIQNKNVNQSSDKPTSTDG